jgi:hypothetical protein
MSVKKSHYPVYTETVGKIKLKTEGINASQIFTAEYLRSLDEAGYVMARDKTWQPVLTHVQIISDNRKYTTPKCKTRKTHDMNAPRKKKPVSVSRVLTFDDVVESPNVCFPDIAEYMGVDDNCALTDSAYFSFLP